MRAQLHAIDRKIAEFLKIAQTLGIERALVHDKMSQLVRTA